MIRSSLIFGAVYLSAGVFISSLLNVLGLNVDMLVAFNASIALAAHYSIKSYAKTYGAYPHGKERRGLVLSMLPWVFVVSSVLTGLAAVGASTSPSIGVIIFVMGALFAMQSFVLLVVMALLYHLKKVAARRLG